MRMFFQVLGGVIGAAVVTVVDPGATVVAAPGTVLPGTVEGTADPVSAAPSSSSRSALGGFGIVLTSWSSGMKANVNA